MRTRITPNTGTFHAVSVLIMFSRISHRMDATKQIISGEEAAIRLASVSSKRKAENAELSNCIESRDETPEKGLEHVGRKI